MSIKPEAGWHDPHQAIFDFSHGAAGRKPKTVGDAEDVRIDGNGGLAKGGVEYDVGRFATDPRQCLERRSCVRNLAVVLANELRAGLEDMGRLGIVEANAVDIALQSFRSEGEHRSRSRGVAKQRHGGLVDAPVGRLR